MIKILGGGYGVINYPDIHDPENALIIEEIVKKRRLFIRK